MGKGHTSFARKKAFPLIASTLVNIVLSCSTPPCFNGSMNGPAVCAVLCSLTVGKIDADAKLGAGAA